MQKILFVLPSHDQLGNTGQKTGFWLEEFASPYYEFIDNGYDVTIASPKGGRPPVDPKSLQTENQTESTKRFQADKSANEKLDNSLVLKEVSSDDYISLFLPGGHGPMWDLSQDNDLKRIVEDFYNKDKIISAVCHGPAGLLQATDKNGYSILKNKRVTGFTNEEEQTVKLDKIVPFSLERRMKELGGNFEKTENFKPFVIHDGQIITGQNPASAFVAARKVIEILK
ncbi:MAG TPA: type 1 glutamine amidotransferase domain-containing protein [Candidatus Nitrosocosmicus sp.]|jgi:putative intracellular protease/amidase|nr:type 1 glutamine amidotransferase domain-containing protein [Candidatus Nitrosocosmicus sp.]